LLSASHFGEIMMRSRDVNLDLLRAVAIIGVLVFHVAGMWPTHHPIIKEFSSLGKYGVNLFFVLSGWLIGGIYWREQELFGKVNVVNFWARRWLRTVPPYIFGMTLGYLSVYFGREEPFDLRYIFFLQNYKIEIPYYKVSWSLCVEEHFYICLPMIGILVSKFKSKTFGAGVLWSLALFSPIFRIIEPGVQVGAPFGYSRTATHLVSEGLIMGVAAAYTCRFLPDQWDYMQKKSKYLALPMMIIFISIIWWEKNMLFYLSPLVVAACCIIWLCASVNQNPLPFSSKKIVYAIAVTSYSIYLTHSLAIHVGLRIANPNGGIISELICFMLWIVAITITGSAFYFCFERTSIQFRDFLVQKWLTPKGHLGGAGPNFQGPLN
jgi:peptidoglycan/LPS O-acetylase OafA/YrhL